MPFLKKSPKVYFAYDIWGLDKRNFLFGEDTRISGGFQKFFERICFKMADGVLHKGRPGELKLLDYNVNRPDLSFVPGCLEEWVCSKNKKQKKEIHLVYAGGPWESHYGSVPFSNIIEKLIPQKIHLSIFGDFVNEKERKEFYKKIKNDQYFHICKKERADKLNKKISGYDYGIIPIFYEGSIKDSMKFIEMANRLFSYIEAGLPIIVNKQSKFIAEIVEDNKIGFSIDYEDLKNLKEIIMKQDYGKMKKNMKKAQEKFKLSKNINILEEFYEKVRENLKINQGRGNNG